MYERENRENEGEMERERQLREGCMLRTCTILRQCLLPSSIIDCSHSEKKQNPLSMFTSTSCSFVDTLLWLRNPCSKSWLQAVKYFKVHLTDGASVGGGFWFT